MDQHLDDDTTFGARLREERERLGMQLHALERRKDVSITYLLTGEH